jgi:hypothetical protein
LISNLLFALLKKGGGGGFFEINAFLDKLCLTINSVEGGTNFLSVKKGGNYFDTNFFSSF